MKRELRAKAQRLKGLLLPENDKLNNEIIAEGAIEALDQAIEITINELRILVDNRITRVQTELLSLDENQIEKVLEDIYGVQKTIDACSDNITKIPKK